MRRTCLSVVLLVGAALAQEREAEPARKPPPATTAINHTVSLRSGSVLVGTIEPREWRVKTKFGHLVVPVAEIVSVQFGRAGNEERVAAVHKLIEDLASKSPERRDLARARLRNEGAFALPDLTKAAKEHADPEVKRSCKELLEEFAPDKANQVADDDRIETHAFTVSGRIEPTSFRVTVPELGPVNVRRNDIVSVRTQSSERFRALEVSTSHNQLGAYLSSHVRVQKGQTLTFSATGTIGYPSWGNQVSTPDGSVRMGSFNGLVPGALMGRIGAKGTPFHIGSKITMKAPASGILELCVVIHPNMRNQPTTGSYTVKLHW